MCICGEGRYVRLLLEVEKNEEEWQFMTDIQTLRVFVFVFKKVILAESLHLEQDFISSQFWKKCAN